MWLHVLKEGHLSSPSRLSRA